MPLRLLLLPLILLAACLDLAFEADLDGPRVVGGTLVGPRTVEVPVRETLVVRLSEPLDQAHLRVALVAWPTVDSCALTPVCREGSCERGSCQTDPIRATDLKALERGDPVDAALPLDAVLQDSADGTGSEVHVTPRRPLAPHARHSLLLFARDRRGAPLVDDDGQAAVWRRDLVTAGPGSSGPEPRLVSPPPGADLVPTDLARVDTAFPRPIDPDPAATLALQSADGALLLLRDPAPCPGWVPDLCLSWRPAEPLAPGAVYRLAVTTTAPLRDRAGRPALEPSEPAMFRAGPGPDLAPPDLTRTSLESHGRCLRARLVALEPLHLRLTAAGAARELVAPPGPVELAVPLVGPPGALVTAQLVATDLAGRTAERTSEHVLGASLDPTAPPLALTELLANPRGPEPAQEFVELLDLRAAGDAITLTGLRLVDGDPDALDLTTGDLLPAFTSTPGQRHLIVPATYDPAEGRDPAPAPGTSLIRVDASLARGGLKNSPGEALALAWDAGPGGPVLLDSHGGADDPGDLPGRSVVKDPGACDVPAAWRPPPGGLATPGAAP